MHFSEGGLEGPVFWRESDIILIKANLQISSFIAGDFRDITRKALPKSEITKIFVTSCQESSKFQLSHGGVRWILQKRFSVQCELSIWVCIAVRVDTQYHHPKAFLEETLPIDLLQHLCWKELTTMYGPIFGPAFSLIYRASMPMLHLLLQLYK